MNEKLTYAEMLGVPVNTCNVTFKQPKKRIFKKKSKPKENLVEAVIENANATVLAEEKDAQAPEQFSLPIENEIEVSETAQVVKVKKPKFKLKISVAAVEVAVICMLLATIFITNAIYPQSGLNVFFRSVLNIESVESADTRIYSDFDVVLPTLDGADYSLSEGVISVSGKSSIYSPANGIIDSAYKTEDGKFNLIIKHNQNFSTTVTGLDIAYLGAGDKVYSNIPVGYVKGGVACLSFTDNLGASIVSYTLSDNQVVWAE